MPGEMRILLFGDQALDPRVYVQSQLVAGRTNPLLCLFLQRVSLALQREIAHLSPLERKYIPNFTTIEELVDRTHSNHIYHAGIESTLLCISQLAHYFE